MFFLEETFLRLEHFLTACPTYSRSVVSGAAVVLSYNGIFTYLFFASVTWVPSIRDRFLWTLWTGLGATGLLLYAAALVPSVTNADAACQAESGSRPAEEAAIVSFVAVYYFIYHTVYPEFSFARGCFLWLTVAYSVLSLWALLHLRLHSSLSLLSGASVGVIGACLSHLGLHFLVLNPESWPLLDQYLKRMRLHRDHHSLS